MAITLQQIFGRYFDSFASRFHVSREMLRAAWCIQHCRTRTLGGHVDSCPEGHYHSIAYNSCRHRCCPQCAWVAREQWLAKCKQRLLPCPHHHIVFTLPSELNRIWRFNKAAYAETLFNAAKETLQQLLKDPKYLGAKPGILAALHTWNQTLLPHVHLHCIVTAGGLAGDGTWRRPQKDCLLPRKVLMLKFRGKFKAMLQQKVQSGKIQLPDSMSASDFQKLLAKLSDKPWNVKIFDAYRDGSGVATYLARYIKGGPIGKSRLLDVQDDKVVFRYRIGTQDGGDGKRQGVTALPIDQFLGRWLEHVPPRRFQTVRGYGLYSGNQYSQLDEARAALGVEPPESDSLEQLTWQQWCESAGLLDACTCPVCGKRLVSHHEFSAGRDPPSDAYSWREKQGQAA
ncbi:Putative transposase [Stieleria neptunia]|uniref:Transposase n=1 Tax=Stieleria neptunia TaxID=2527979 RepID=A0A518I151_9BACT|nr:transposase [Stieleria neptunia]QDV46845.1 Putative transposase [Stieleria neptunia]